jgi:hypothetical protein
VAGALVLVVVEVAVELDVAGVPLVRGLTTVWPVPIPTVNGVETVPAVVDSKHPVASNAIARIGSTSSEGRRRM